MRVFVTGATGFIGSDEGEKLLAAAGAEVHRGRMEDLESLRGGAAKADGVIHLAFIHEFSDAKLSARLGVMAGALMGKGLVSSFLGVMMGTDSTAIDALGAAIAGTGKPLLITVGTMGLAPGRLATETDAADPNSAGAARSVPSEKASLKWAEQGVRTSVLRLPPSVHGDGDAGLVPRLFAIARKKGVSAYVGDGTNHWPAVHRLDAARLYRLALENGSGGGTYHGVAEQGVPFREIAEVIGRRLNVPVVSKTAKEAAGHFSFLAPFVAADNLVSSQITQQQLDWHPTQPALIPDIDRPGYFKI
jgi:nucleoside-diphosphate-sugar epimerase